MTYISFRSNIGSFWLIIPKVVGEIYPTWETLLKIPLMRRKEVQTNKHTNGKVKQYTPRHKCWGYNNCQSDICRNRKCKYQHKNVENRLRIPNVSYNGIPMFPVKNHCRARKKNISFPVTLPTFYLFFFFFDYSNFFWPSWIFKSIFRLLLKIFYAFSI